MWHGVKKTVSPLSYRKCHLFGMKVTADSSSDRYANTVNDRTLQEIVTSQEMGDTAEEQKHTWASHLAREAAMILRGITIQLIRVED